MDRTFVTILKAHVLCVCVYVCVHMYVSMDKIHSFDWSFTNQKFDLEILSKWTKLFSCWLCPPHVPEPAASHLFYLLCKHICTEMLAHAYTLKKIKYIIQNVKRQHLYQQKLNNQWHDSSSIFNNVIFFHMPLSFDVIKIRHNWFYYMHLIKNVTIIAENMENKLMFSLILIECYSFNIHSIILIECNHIPWLWWNDLLNIP